MAVRKRSKRRNRHRSDSEPVATRIPAKASPGPSWAKARARQGAHMGPEPGFMAGEQRQSFLRLLSAVMVPGRAFFVMQRPVPGLVCLGLQASLVGWLPAAIWAAYATTHVQRKQRALAARLRPG